MLTRLFNDDNHHLAGLYVQRDIGSTVLGQPESTGNIFVQSFYTDGTMESEPFGQDIQAANARALECLKTMQGPTLKKFRDDPVLAVSPFRLCGAFIDGTNCLVRFRNTQYVMCVRQPNEYEATALARRLTLK